jgi:histidinol-phosphate/aromatic aminotransferase/cobyric acid decarboxylase-like protein
MTVRLDARGGASPAPPLDPESPLGAGPLAADVRFPLADWIDDHAECRHDLGSSGMRGSVRHPLPTRSEVRRATESELCRQLADMVGVDASRVFLTHGATEANSWAIFYLRGRHPTRSARCRVRYPEYPPLFDTARSAGFRLTTATGTSELAVISQPRNPVGDRWGAAQLAEWTEGSRATLVDETFREFTTAPSVRRLGLAGLWTTSTFTKVYGADDLRVGFVVPPEEEAEAFSRFHGLVTDRIAPYSVAGALAVLSHREAILREVRSIFVRHAGLWRRANPGGPEPAAPLAFDDPVPGGGDRFARRCLRSSVLVSPGAYFGRATGVRVTMTRRSFPRDFAAYLRVRAAA